MRIIEIGALHSVKELDLPVAALNLPCGVTGFPSPADDYSAERLDLNRHLIKHPAATYYARAEGDSMIGAGIFPGDILVVDRSITEVQNKVIVAWLNSEFVVKRYHLDPRTDRAFLISENEKYPPYEVTPEADFVIWGVVTYSIHKP